MKIFQHVQQTEKLEKIILHWTKHFVQPEMFKHFLNFFKIKLKEISKKHVIENWKIKMFHLENVKVKYLIFGRVCVGGVTETIQLN